ncbi:MAG: FprA family A-type flavoprotein [Clostridia bacterium]|nr:FprA family A-type flavoprotein [Clostridia bacterium]
MHVSKVTDGVYQLSINIENMLFEGLWEVPNGVSMNSYIIKGEKTAIIDGVCGWDGVPEHFFGLLKELDIEPESIEYVILNHMEPDHTGWIEDLKKIHNNFKVICTKKGAPLLEAFFNHTENIMVVGDGDTLDLGGHVLEFAEIPNVHWPDTMATFDHNTGTLFSCDAFGSYGRVDHGNYDDMLSEEDLKWYEEEAVRYYANIVAAFSMFVDKAITKCAGLPIKIIAPGHGVVWRKDPMRIVEDYKRYVAYQKGPAMKEITVLWGSMYGMTEKGVNKVVELLEKEEDIKVNVHELPQTSWGQILKSVWTSTGVVLAMPTYEYKMFPPMAAALEELGKKKAVNRLAFRIGSYGWSGGAQKELDHIMEQQKMNWSFIDPVEYKGAPTKDDLVKIEAGVKALVEAVREAVK